MSHVDEWELIFGYFQDRATCHTPEWPLEEIKGLFGNRIILKGFWLHQSPNMTLMDFFPWGLLKERRVS
jgi:hypothetical protein